MRDTQRQACLPGQELADYVAEAIAFLRSHEPPEGYFLGFSGGKDSIATLELCRMARVKFEAYHSCTRIDPPEIYRFIRENYPWVKWLYPKESFWSMVRRKGPPMRMSRWCCDELKKKPARAIPLPMRLMGIRAEESSRRAARPRVDRISRAQVLLKPIFMWPEWAVWEFIDSRGLAYPSLYDEGIDRIGCVICPMAFGKSSAKLKRQELYMARWPSLWRLFEKAVRDWFNMRACRDGTRPGQRFVDAGEFWENYIHDNPAANRIAGGNGAQETLWQE